MIVVVFPGQGSQRHGMGSELYQSCSESRVVFERVQRATGIDVAQLCFETGDEALKRTENAQVALFTTGLAALAALGRDNRFEPFAIAGHSVGEYAALVAAGIYSLEDGARLVQRRGALMAEAGEGMSGAMAAILGLDAESVTPLCEATAGVVVVANDNSPGQVVISGEAAAVSAAGRTALERGAKRVIPINVSGAFHSPLMAGAASKMRVALSESAPADGFCPVYSNVTSEPAPAFQWPELLEKQLCGRVRWTESVQHMVRDGATTFIECGSGQVLSGLIGRIEPAVARLTVNDVESLEKTVSTLASS